MDNELIDIVDLFDEFIFLNEQPLPNQVKQIKETENPIKINFKGSNINGMVFLFANPLNSTDSEFIQNVVNALKLNIHEMALIIQAEQVEITIANIIEELKPKKMVCWGRVSIDSFSSALVPYQIQKINQVDMLLADDVSQFHENKSLKTQLWTQLQALIK